MEEQQIIDKDTGDKIIEPKKRRALLPVWVVIFCLIFMLMGQLVYYPY